MKQIIFVTQTDLWGNVCCRFGAFTTKEKAVKAMNKKLKASYKNIKNHLEYDEYQDVYVSNHYEFRIAFETITLDVLEEF